MADGSDHRYRPLAGRVFDGPPADPATPHGRREPIPPQPATRPQKAPDTGGPRHIWVINCPEAPGTWPGVLLGWERSPKGWLGRVMMAVEGAEGMVTMTLWVHAHHLRPIDIDTPR